MASHRRVREWDKTVSNCAESGSHYGVVGAIIASHCFAPGGRARALAFAAEDRLH